MFTSQIYLMGFDNYPLPTCQKGVLIDMMYPYPGIFDDLLTKVKNDIKGSDPIPKMMERIVKEEFEEETKDEDSGSKSE